MANSYLRFWGVRGSYPAPYPSHMGIGGNTPCVELRLDDHLLVFDAGTGIIALGQQLVRSQRRCHIHLFLTHFHWDHISGLPFFDPAFTEGFTLTIHGPADSEQQLASLLAEQMKAPYFPVETETWLATVNYDCLQHGAVSIGSARITPFTTHHPGLTYGYRIETGQQTIVFAPDNEILFVNHVIASRRDEFDQDEQALLEALKQEQKERAIELMRDADLLIHDAQYTERDYVIKKGWGHSCYLDTVNTAIDAGVKQLFLFSYDPTYDDHKVEQLHQHTLELLRERGSNMSCHKTREGMVIELEAQSHSALG